MFKISRLDIGGKHNIYNYFRAEFLEFFKIVKLKPQCCPLD
jgi:hypothetical protein